MSLKTYTSEELQIIGETTVDVTYQLLRLVVVKEEGPALFGRNWLAIVKLDWSNICHNSEDGRPRIKSLID